MPQVSENGKRLTDVSSNKTGNVKNCVYSWREISSDPWLISTIQGVEIPFMEVPVQLREPHPYKLLVDECKFVEGELDRLQERGVLETTDPSAEQVVIRFPRHIILNLCIQSCHKKINLRFTIHL